MCPRPYQYIDTPAAWRTCLERLNAEPRVALDAEANSLFAYRESLCLLQATIPDQDYIIDPLAGFELEGLGELLANPSIEKIFHASEYDLILLKREFDWDVHGLFDTMWAARLLGYKNMGLARFLEERFDVKLSKKHQKANWGARPLSESQLKYAQLDTHYLLELRDQMADELHEKGCWEEALEIFAEAAQVKLPDRSFDEHSFWSIRGVHDLKPRARAILRELDHIRNAEAKRRNTPPFKVISNKALVAIAKVKPQSRRALQEIPVVSDPLVQRLGRSILEAVDRGMQAEPPKRQNRPKRLTKEERERLDQLTAWRKDAANRRGVESDVVLHRDTLFEIARANPATADELRATGLLGPCRFALYADEILAELNGSPETA